MAQSQQRPSYAQGFARSAAESACPNLWQGFIGGWAPFLGPSGTTLYDMSGYGNHGTLQNITLSEWVREVEGWALLFAGTDEYVDLPISSVLQPDIGVTMLVRASTNGSNSQESFICVDDGSFNDYELYIKDTGSGRGMFMRIVTSGQSVFTHNFTPDVDQYRSYAGSWRAGTAKMYVEGEHVFTGSGGSGSISYPGIVAIRIGSDLQVTTNYIGMTLSYLYLWSRDLTDNEVADIHDGASPLLLPSRKKYFIPAAPAGNVYGLVDSMFVELVDGGLVR